eukprot:TRINITY_DN4926_c1_g3_i2.p1 TRINITY_DN4926_c1_g3~~TRINITY_DN4926_c1_g3_i2.p1  ORF type:complete len:461 (-),score=54.27 TRINITY_DN4926_c1_g3_i2:57-1403(-)
MSTRGWYYMVVMMLMLLLGICSVTSQDQNAILSEFYQATGGPTWNNALYSAWSDTPSPDACTWQGITCNIDNKIVSIIVSANLTGTLPSILGNLTSLTTVQLNPGGPYIQTELYGTVPAVWFTSNTQLSSLNLHGLRVTSPLPIEMASVPLQSLDPSLTGVTEVPSWIVDLRGTLTSVNFSGAKLAGSTLPPSFWALNNLVYINFFQPDPYGVGLSGSISGSIVNMQSLRTISFSGNSLSGIIPDQIGELPNLYFLDLIHNRFVGTIPSLEKNINLRTVWLGSIKNPTTGLVGSLPAFSNHSVLSYIDIQRSNISGTIPSSWSSLSSITTILLVGNKLEGTIPAFLGDLPNLNTLHLRDNRFVGTIPVGLSSIDTSMEFARNRLCAPFPSWCTTSVCQPTTQTCTDPTPATSTTGNGFNAGSSLTSTSSNSNMLFIVIMVFGVLIGAI